MTLSAHKVFSPGIAKAIGATPNDLHFERKQQCSINTGNQKHPCFQLQVWFPAFAYILLEAVRRVGLHKTRFADATVSKKPRVAVPSEQASLNETPIFKRQDESLFRTIQGLQQRAGGVKI
jgi:hypothetical protein